MTLVECRPSLDGMVAYITGGLGGIGSACVASLLAHGCRVAFTYAEGHESAKRAQAVVDSAPDRLSAHALDLRSDASIRACMDAVVARWGMVNILVNAAAVGSATVRAYADDAATQDSVMLAINSDGNLKVCLAFLVAAQPTIDSVPRKLKNFSSLWG